MLTACNFFHRFQITPSTWSLLTRLTLRWSRTVGTINGMGMMTICDGSIVVWPTSGGFWNLRAACIFSAGTGWRRTLRYWSASVLTCLTILSGQNLPGAGTDAAKRACAHISLRRSASFSPIIIKGHIIRKMMGLLLRAMNSSSMSWLHWFPISGKPENLLE